MKNRIKAAINCLRGNPTAYRVIIEGGIRFDLDDGFVAECQMHHADDFSTKGQWAVT